MKLHRLGWVLVILACLTISARAQEKADLVGEWGGALKLGVVELRIVFKIEQNDKGELAGKLISVDQNNAEVPFASLSLTDGTLKGELPQMMAKYEGKLSAAKDSVEGTFTQAGSPLALNLKKGVKMERAARPQEPKEPYGYLIEDVTFPGGVSDVKLAGTLTIPSGPGPWPAVILVSGSGAQDRDEAIMGHRPFWVLADHLTKRGVAVLRYDDRGVAKSTGNHAKATSKDFKDDALAAVAYLKGRKEIDGRKIGIAGHSEGGLIAPMAAIESSDVAFIVMLAGPGVTGQEILKRQAELILKAEGMDEKLVEKRMAVNREIYKIVGAENDRTKVKEQIEAMLDKNPLDEDQRNALETAGTDLKKQLDAQLDQLMSPWFQYFLVYDPRTSLSKVKCPVLAINGQRDTQVEPAQNLPEIEKALKAAGNADFTLRELPELNHLFQTCKTGAVSEYSQIEETISPAALNAVSDWITARFKSK